MAASLDQLGTFLAVYRAGSITAAAHRVGLAQPTVTAQVKALEAALGRTLFERGSRGVTPTAAADYLARRLAGPLDAVEDVLADGVGTSTTGRVVTLGGPAELVCTRVLPVLAGLVADGLQLRVTLGLPDALMTAVADGRLDLAISTLRPRRRGVLAEPLCDEELVIVAGASLAEALHAPLSVGELEAAMASVPTVAYAEDQPLLRRYWRDALGARIARPPDLVVPDLRGVLAAVLAGAGITVLPRYLCQPELDAGSLRLLCQPDLPPINTLYLMQRAGVPGYPALAAVRARLLAEARSW